MIAWRERRMEISGWTFCSSTRSSGAIAQGVVGSCSERVAESGGLILNSVLRI